MSDERTDLVKWILNRYKAQLSRWRYYKLRRRLLKTPVDLLCEIREDFEAADKFQPEKTEAAQ